MADSFACDMGFVLARCRVVEISKAQPAALVYRFDGC